MNAAVARLTAYLAEHDRRVAGGGNLDAEVIHSFGLDDGAARLLASDLRAVLAVTRDDAAPDASPDDFCELSCGRRAAFIVRGPGGAEKRACGNHLAAAVRAVSEGLPAGWRRVAQLLGGAK